MEVVLVDTSIWIETHDEIVSPYDCLIASCAIRNNVPLLQRDRDFERIAEVVPLELLPNA